MTGSGIYICAGAFVLVFVAMILLDMRKGRK